MRIGDFFRARSTERAIPVDTESPSSDLSALLAQPITTLAATGIVNPHGPTLTAVSVLGDGRTGEGALVSVMLNPFSQEIAHIGPVSLPVQWESNRLLSGFSSSFGSCPTLILPSSHLSTETAVLACAELLQSFPNGGNVLERVKRHFANPWDRVAEEVGAMAALLKAYQETGSTSVADSPLDADEARELANLLLSVEHTVPELEAFNYAWNGAIAHAPALPAMNFAQFLFYFIRITESCVVPQNRDSAE